MTENDNVRLERLILAVAQGHASCLDGIYSTAGKRMFAVAISIVGRDNAEDVVHDSLIKIARFAKKYKKDTNPFGWVLMLTRNTALDLLKSKKVHPQVSTEEFYSLASSDYSPDKREDAILLEQAISKLDKDEKQVIYYKYFLDMTVRDIAAETGKSKSSVQRLTEKAEIKLKDFLEAGRKDELNR